MIYLRGPRTDCHKNFAEQRIAKKKNNEANERLFSFASLCNAFATVKSTSGNTPGADGLTAHSFNEDQWAWKLKKLQHLLNKGKYLPGPMRQISMRKANGGYRSIKIPTIVDRIVYRATLEAINPNIDKAFVPWSFGFRPNKSYLNLLANIALDFEQGLNFLVHFDIQKAFDSVQTRKLQDVIRRQNINSQLKLLLCCIANKQLPGPNSEEVHEAFGIDQGNALSGFLFNLFLDENHDRIVYELITDSVKIYRYADNIVITGNNECLVNETKNKSINCLHDCGLTCIQDETVNLKTNNANILGLTLSGISSNIVFSLPESSWTKLTQRLDECLNHEEPHRNINLVAQAWLRQTAPASWTGKEASKLRKLLKEFGTTKEPTEATTRMGPWERILQTEKERRITLPWKETT